MITQTSSGSQQATRGAKSAGAAHARAKNYVWLAESRLIAVSSFEDLVRPCRFEKTPAVDRLLYKEDTNVFRLAYSIKAELRYELSAGSEGWLLVRLSLTGGSVSPPSQYLFRTVSTRSLSQPQNALLAFRS